MKSQDTRVSELEKRSGGDVEIAVSYDDEQTVRMMSGEILTREEFELRYPDATIIHVTYDDGELEPDDVI